jgi:hypothetical protein
MKKATPEQIAEWKKAHGEVLCLEDAESGQCIYIKRPDRTILGLAASKSQASKNSLDYVGAILQNCALGEGNDTIVSDTRFQYSCVEQIDAIIGKRVVTIKNC